MHTKSQISNVFKKFKILVENQTSHKIRNLRTNNARKYLSITPFFTNIFIIVWRVLYASTKWICWTKNIAITRDPYPSRYLFMLIFPYTFGLRLLYLLFILLMCFHLMVYMVIHVIINSLTRYLIILISKFLSVLATLT